LPPVIAAAQTLPVRTCASCGGSNAEGARFCQFCGTPFPVVEPAGENRRTVTIVFTDVTGSTSLGERLDPESLRRVMSRYFEAMRAVIERHGGTVEKYIGDAVMAVFGIPQLHEDDAIRAVRATDEMRTALRRLNEELRKELGVEIGARTGVNTGEVVAGDPSSGQRLVTGDTVNIAARLEQAAAPGQVLMGAATHELVRDVVDTEPLPPLSLKGKSDAMTAFRLARIRSDLERRERHLDSPIVGRDRPLRLLRDALESAIADRACHLFTVLGSAGVGKSRLVAEFLGSLGPEVTVLRGRCLSYGEGVALWPIVQILASAAGIADVAPVEEATEAIRRLVDSASESEGIVARTSPLFGGSAAGAIEETYWAVRRLFEILGTTAPAIVLVDDIHWAEPTLLDLLEHVADWARDAAILLLCTARPELLDSRSNWGGGKLNATSILLEPLSAGESHELMANLLGPAELPESVQDRITKAAEGNPLFVEEMLRMLIDDGSLVREDEGWIATRDLAPTKVPPTIHALLAARIDRLGPDERAIMERGSVEGKLFHVGGVTRLCPEPLRPAVRPSLMALVRKELIRPDRSELVGEDAFRFRHMLLRDAAYESMPKETRADLHERFAAWFEERAPQTIELDAILAYHLEQAASYRGELGIAGAHERELAHKAASRYLDAGRSAMARGDARSARNVLVRAVDLLPAGDELLPRAMYELGNAQQVTGQFSAAERSLNFAIAAATDPSNERIALLAGVVLHEVRSRTDTDLSDTAYLSGVDGALARFAELADDEGIAVASLARIPVGSWEENLAAAERAAMYARRAGLSSLESRALSLEAISCIWSDVPADDGAERCRSILRRISGDRYPEAVVHSALGFLVAAMGRIDEGRGEVRRSRELLASLGIEGQVPYAFTGCYVGLLAGDLEEARTASAEGVQAMERLGEKNRLSTLAAMVARTFASEGDILEAEHYIAMAEEAAQPDDVDTFGTIAIARAYVQSVRGQHEDAARVAQDGVRLFAPRSRWQQAEAYVTLGDVLVAAGRLEDAAAAYRNARTAFEAKRLLPFVEQIHEKLRAFGR
jgi:class 3 adenylate cyclase/tetratricopeptide (TPR) repeat protein